MYTVRLIKYLALRYMYSVHAHHTRTEAYSCHPPALEAIGWDYVFVRLTICHWEFPEQTYMYMI